MKSAAIETFYDNFSSKLVTDYVYGNKRVDFLRNFLRQTISAKTRTILEVGCGIGSNAAYLVKKVAERSSLTAVDVSAENIRIAKRLFSDPRIVFLCQDICEWDHGAQRFDVIILPDVYEHIPRARRDTLHKALSQHLENCGKIIMSVPSPEHQEFLRRRGEGLQVVDEVVTLEDIISMSLDVEGTLTYFAKVSVWQREDYMYAVIERGSEAMSSLRGCDERSLTPVRRDRKHRYLRKGILCRFGTYRRKHVVKRALETNLPKVS